MSAPLAEDRSGEPGDEVVLADWVAELAERLEGGEAVELSALAEAHPERADELRRILPTMRKLARFGRDVARGPESPGTIRPGPEDGFGTLGDFRLLREVGRGGMGIVYEAEQISLRRRVALKILPLAAAFDPRRQQRFLLEARAAACLHHTHIVPVFAVGSERGVPYYAMQFIDGCTLAEVLEQLGEQEGPMRPGAEAFAVGTAGGPGTSLGTSNRDTAYIRAVADHGRRAAEALDHAHSRGILHRDIKPANLMLDVEGHLWITDFGLAQIQGDSRLTLTGDVLGTLRYMSPEQAIARRVVIDGRTDLYSLGATLYELLALRPVFDGGVRTEILRQIAEDEPIPLRRLNPTVPRDLETIVHKTLAKEPSDRYATARDLANDLGRFLDSRPIVAQPPSRWERLGKWARRNRAVVVPAALFAALALLGVGGGLVWSNNWLRSHNERLRAERDRAGEFSRELKAQRDLAEQRRRVADYHLHAFRLRQAGEALRVGQLEKAQEILRDCRPGPGEDDPREFVWHHLWREATRGLVLLSERSEQVASLALSADGTTVATGDRDGTIRLRDAGTGAVRREVRGQPSPVTVLAFSADGRRLASGTQRALGDPSRKGGELLVWDTATGQPIARFAGDAQCDIGPLRFDASGAFLWEQSEPWSGGVDLLLWKLEGDPDALRPRLFRRFEGRRHLPVSADGRRSATLEDEGRVVVVEEPASGRVLCRLSRAAAGYECVGLSADGRRIAIATATHDSPVLSCTLAVWEVDTGRSIVDRRMVPLDIVAQLEFSPDGRAVIARSAGGTLYSLALDSRAAWRIDPDPQDWGRSASDVVFLPGGEWLAWRGAAHSGGARPLRIYDRATGAVRATFPGRWDDVSNLAGLPDRRSLAFRSGARAVVWHFAPADDPQPAGHTDEAWAVGFSSDGRVLATGSDDTDDPRTLKLWDVATGRLLRGWKAHDATTGAVAFQPGGRIIASAGLLAEENLRLWDAATGARIATLAGHSDRVRTVAFRPDGRLLASAGSDRTIRLWDTADRRCVRTLVGHLDAVRQVAFSPDGRTLASVGNDLTVRLWDLGRGESTWTWKGGVKIASVAFSPDGRILAWVHEDGVVQRWDLTRGHLLAPLHSEYDELRCLAFTSDGRTLAAAGKSGAIHLWDPVSGQELLALEGRPCQVNALAFAPDGGSLAACWHDGAVRIFRAR